MYNVTYTGLEDDLYVDYAVRHPSQFLHKNLVTPPDSVRKEVFEPFKDDLSFSAYVRIFESIGVINWPICCGMVGADFAIYYRVAARLLQVSETELLDMLERERLTPQAWVPIHHYEERGIVFVSCPRFQRAELDMFRDVLARFYILRHPGVSPTHYVVQAPLRSSNTLYKNLMPQALRRFLEIEACLSCMYMRDARLHTVLKDYFMLLYPKLSIAVRLLL